MPGRSQRQLINILKNIVERTVIDKEDKNIIHKIRVDIN